MPKAPTNDMATAQTSMIGWKMRIGNLHAAFVGCNVPGL
jgi:hypothetical protein